MWELEEASPAKPAVPAKVDRKPVKIPPAAPQEPPPAIAPFDADTARKHQETWAEYLGVPVEFENSIGMKFVLIPPGEFDMGSTEEEVAKLLEEARATNQPSWYIERLPAEAPRHRVRITKPFYLGGAERGDRSNLPERPEGCSAQIGPVPFFSMLLDERTGVSYPDIAQAPNGDIYVHYDRDRYGAAEILFARFREEDVKAGKLASEGASLNNLVKSKLGMNHGGADTATSGESK